MQQKVPATDATSGCAAAQRASTPIHTPRRASPLLPWCSVGLLLADPTGRQFFSTLQPLTKEQAKAIKAAEAAAIGGGGKRARASGKGKGKGTAGAAAGAAAAAPSGGGGGAAAAVGAAAEAAAAAKPAGDGEPRVVGLCVQPIHVSPATGEGRPGDS